MRSHAIFPVVDLVTCFAFGKYSGAFVRIGLLQQGRKIDAVDLDFFDLDLVSLDHIGVLRCLAVPFAADVINVFSHQIDQ